MSKVQPLNDRTKERTSRRERQRQSTPYYDETIQWEALCAFVEPIASAAGDRAARDYLDQKDLVTKSYLNERLEDNQKYIVAELRKEMSEQTGQLRKEMSEQNMSLRDSIAAVRLEIATSEARLLNRLVLWMTFISGISAAIAIFGAKALA